MIPNASVDMRGGELKYVINIVLWLCHMDQSDCSIGSGVYRSPVTCYEALLTGVT